MTDQLPPHDDTAEKAVLGCILLDPVWTMGELESGGFIPEAFYNMRHQLIYSACQNIHSRGEMADLITVQAELASRNFKEQSGGFEYLSGLGDGVGSARSLKMYLKVVEDHHRRRMLMAVAAGIIDQAEDMQRDVAQTLADAERDILSIGVDTSAKQAVHIRSAIPEVINEIERDYQSDGRVTGIATGLPDLDRIQRGMNPGDLIIIAGRPSLGKTSLSMQVAAHNAEQGIPIGVFSLEMTTHQLTRRMLLSGAKVNIMDASRGFLTERDFPKLASYAGKLTKAPIYIDDSAGLTDQQICSRSRRMMSQWKVRLVVIDYLQRVNIGSQDPRVGYGRASTAFKNLAKDLGIPVLLCSQLNRESDKAARRPPRLSDLKETGNLEEDADGVGLLWNPKPDGDRYSDAIELQLLYEKNRNGPTGPVDLMFLRSFTRFESASKVSEQDVPTSRNPHNDD